jgi:hypothetical protein
MKESMYNQLLVIRYPSPVVRTIEELTTDNG